MILKYQRTMFSMAIKHSPILFFFCCLQNLTKLGDPLHLTEFHVKRAFEAVDFPRDTKGAKGVNRP